MDYINQIRQSAFEDELQKIADDESSDKQIDSVIREWALKHPRPPRFRGKRYKNEYRALKSKIVKERMKKYWTEGQKKITKKLKKRFKNINKDDERIDSIMNQVKQAAFENELEKIAGKEFKTLEKNKVPLTDEERAEVMSRDATWHHGLNGEKSSAVWKSVDKKTGKVTYVTHTHRAFNTATTLKGAINRYHKFIKGTA